MPAIDVTDATFEAEVLTRSDSVPVVIDLWAPWCGPCRTLGPIIEKVVDSTEGRVALAKVNIDENPGVQSAFRVQSIPAVFAISKRRVVDAFVGALPERAVQEFVDRIGGEPSEVDMLVEAGDETSLRKALELEPANEQAIVALARLLSGRGDAEEALGLLSKVPENEETRRVAAEARLAESGGGVAAGASTGDGADARLAELIERVPGDDAARQEIVDLIETMDADDPRRAEWRRALAAKLF